VVIDEDSAALSKLEAGLDIMTVVGHGANPAILEEAQIKKADVVVSVTKNWDTNILAGMMAKRAGAKHVVARVGDTDYLQKFDFFNVHDMGIDYAINPCEQCAQDIVNMIKLPGTRETVSLLGGRVIAAAIELPGNSPLVGIPIKDLPNKEILDQVRFIARIRDEQMIIPFGDTQFNINDIVYAVGAQEDITKLLYWSCPDARPIDKLIIAGGAGTGLKLAAKLEKEMDVFLIEPELERARKCSEILKKTVVMHGNMLSQEIYQEINFSDRTAFVAAGPNDEDNIIASLLAQKRYSASFTVAQLKDSEYLPVIDSLDVVDRTVSIHLSLVNSVLQFIRGEHVLAAAELHATSGELLELIIEESGRWNGKTIAEIKMPSESIIATVQRDDQVIPATGALGLLTGDRLVVFATPKAATKLRSFCSK
jgi:trk system potassium uptake protein TrkA